jgi:hypothetical protein
VIHGGYTGINWEVEESLGEVLKLIKQTEVPNDWC